MVCMFRKILLSYFPDIKDNELSPIHFHLRLLSPKLFYGISSKYWVENRRVVWLDQHFSYFLPSDLKFISSKDEAFYYAYKNFATLNGYNNYNLYVILSSLLLFILKSYYKYFNIWDIKYYISPLLYSFNYLLIFFYSRFKQYESHDDNENLDFMLNIIESIILQLEVKNKNSWKLTYKLMNIIKKEPEVLMFIYKTTKTLSNIHSWKNYTDINLYNYFASSSIANLSFDWKLQHNLNESCKQIFLKRYTFYVWEDMLMIGNAIIGDKGYIGYLINPKNFDFMPYFVASLSHIDNINLKKSLYEIIDDILNFNVWGNKFITALKDFNADNVDINIDPSLWPEQVQELMSKDTMDSVKKVSNINEQFLDYYILLISRKINNNQDNLQSELLNQKALIKLKKSNTFFYDYDNYVKIKDNYIKLDKNYFIQSKFFKSKKKLSPSGLSYNIIDKILNHQTIISSKKNILSDFWKKTHKEYVNNKDYLNILKKYFQKDITRLLNSDNLLKDYLLKYYDWCFNEYELTWQEVINFKENIYYPDFIVYYSFLRFYKKQFTQKNILIAWRLKDSLFWYIISQYILWYNKEIEAEYLSWVNFYCDDIDLNLEDFYNQFVLEYSPLIEIFTNVKQNNKFLDISLSMIDNISYKNFYIYDVMKDITYYNKRMFKI